MLVNGYSGLTPKETEQFTNQLLASLQIDNEQDFLTLLNQYPVNYLKLNKKEIYPYLTEKLKEWDLKTEELTNIYEDEQSVIFTISQ
jgi:hypothetical protein